MALLGDHFPNCDRCENYIIPFAYHCPENFGVRCRCDELNTSSERVSEIAKGEHEPARRTLTISARRAA